MGRELSKFHGKRIGSRHALSETEEEECQFYRDAGPIYDLFSHALFTVALVENICLQTLAL